VLKVNREARTAGIKTAVLSNSLGRAPHDPYAPYYLVGNFDAVVLLTVVPALRELLSLPGA
jgi:putative hydrolase of the HAD superfamily